MAPRVDLWDSARTRATGHREDLVGSSMAREGRPGQGQVPSGQEDLDQDLEAGDLDQVVRACQVMACRMALRDLQVPVLGQA